MKRSMYRLISMSLLSIVPIATNAIEASAETKILPKVTVAVAQLETVADRVPFTGTLIARQEVHINAQLSGIQIQKIHVETGALIRKGDVLIQLESQDLRSKLAQIDAEILRAEASIRQSHSRISATEASFRLASNSVLRNTELAKSNSIAQSTLDDSLAAADEAKALSSMAREDLAIALAELENLRVQLEVAQLNVSRTVIKAPVSGVITARSAHIGAIVSPGGEPLLTLMTKGEIELEAEVLETALSRIRQGDRAQFALADGAMRQGSVRSISPSVDMHTRLGTVKISITDNADTWIGSFAQGWLSTREYDALTIPASAVQSTEKGEVVSVVEAGVIEKRNIVTGVEFQGQREIREGLLIGEQVLTRASSFYQDGDRVSVITPATNMAESSTEAAMQPTSGGVL